MSDHYREWDDEDPPPRAGRRDSARGRYPVDGPRPGPRPTPEPASNADPMSLIPGPDETTLLPRIPDDFDDGPADDVPERRRARAIRRHRDDSPPVTGKARTTVRVFAEVFVTFGMIVLLFAAYQLWGKTAEINNAQERLDDELEQAWEGDDDPTLSPVPGNAVARLYMPQIRPEPWTIVEGTALSDIETAPGHYENSVMPGGRGNFAVAGHNVPAIFRHIDVLRPGDEIVVETKSSFYIYEITGFEIVKPTQVEVVAPVPNQPGVEPGEDDRYLTLTTCHPWWDNYERYIVYGKLVETRDRGDELPPEAVG